MYTNIEFLGTEPIENVITSMHFQVDKTIFFGYEETIKEYKNQTENFLKKYCNVKEIVFHVVSEKDLNAILEVMKRAIEEEQAQGNELFFDLTGGESLILVAFGMLSKEYETPMHQYDVEEDKLIELNPGHSKSIVKCVEQKTISLNLERYIEMRGAKINRQLDKDLVDTSDELFMDYIRKLWSVMVKYKNNWNFYANILKAHFKDDHLYASATIVEDMLHDFKDFRDYMKALAEAGVLVAYKEEAFPDLVEKTKDGKTIKKKRVKISFYYKSVALKDCLWKSGTVLELHVYEEMKGKSDDCAESVFIDWDGIIYGGRGKDVYNEIDVICIKDNIPTIISCKAGRMDDGQALQPMYELETVSSRFGGKYARKVLATLQPIVGVYADRAKEMGIELWCYG